MEERIEKAVNSLKEELEGAKKARLVSVVVGAVLFFIVFFVLLTMTRNIKKAVQPAEVAEVAVFATRQLVTQGRPEVEKAFKQNIPVFLKNMRISLVNDLVPALRTEMEKMFKDAIVSAFLSSSKAFTDAVKDAVARAKENAKKMGTPPPDALASIIVQEFEAESQKRYNDKPEETLGAQFAQSQKMLEGLQQRLLLLTGKKKPATKEEALEMKFLKAWVSLLTKGGALEAPGPAVVSPEPSGAEKPVPPMTPK